MLTWEEDVEAAALRAPQPVAAVAWLRRSAQQRAKGTWSPSPVDVVELLLWFLAAGVLMAASVRVLVQRERWWRPFAVAAGATAVPLGLLFWQPPIAVGAALDEALILALPRSGWPVRLRLGRDERVAGVQKPVRFTPTTIASANSIAMSRCPPIASPPSAYMRAGPSLVLSPGRAPILAGSRGRSSRIPLLREVGVTVSWWKPGRPGNRPAAWDRLDWRQLSGCPGGRTGRVVAGATDDRRSAPPRPGWHVIRRGQHRSLRTAIAAKLPRSSLGYGLSTPPGDVNLRWLHRDGLIWPYLRGISLSRPR